MITDKDNEAMKERFKKALDMLGDVMETVVIIGTVHDAETNTTYINSDSRGNQYAIEASVKEYFNTTSDIYREDI